MYAQPDYPAALASLQGMTSDQLKEVLNSEDKFEEFIKELPQMKALYGEKEMLLASNKSLAEYNLSQEPVMRECKASLVEKYGTAGKLAEEVKTLQAELESSSGQVKPDTLLALLEAANQEAEEESETLMEDFLQDGGSVEQFLENYQEKRKLAHLRRIKVDKMKELLRKKSGPARTAPPPPLPYPSYGQSSVAPLPYPTQAMHNMPMAPSYR
eukprot:GFUD01013811.1.p1 GENE.GFUD01013811.1~~GFUD01013811.1.p1  ORF type:complete len:213 (-),score=105.17 GFUD01013811.1:115-753(-)